MWVEGRFGWRGRLNRLICCWLRGLPSLVAWWSLALQLEFFHRLTMCMVGWAPFDWKNLFFFSFCFLNCFQFFVYSLVAWWFVLMIESGWGCSIVKGAPIVVWRLWWWTYFPALGGCCVRLGEFDWGVANRRDCFWFFGSCGELVLPDCDRIFFSHELPFVVVLPSLKLCDGFLEMKRVMIERVIVRMSCVWRFLFSCQNPPLRMFVVGFRRWNVAFCCVDAVFPPLSMWSNGYGRSQPLFSFCSGQ